MDIENIIFQKLRQFVYTENRRPDIIILNDNLLRSFIINQGKKLHVYQLDYKNLRFQGIRVIGTNNFNENEVEIH